MGAGGGDADSDRSAAARGGERSRRHKTKALYSVAQWSSLRGVKGNGGIRIFIHAPIGRFELYFWSERDYVSYCIFDGLFQLEHDMLVAARHLLLVMGRHYMLVATRQNMLVVAWKIVRVYGDSERKTR